MWEVGSTWLGVWAVKEEKGTAARWGQLGERVEPPGRAQGSSAAVAAVHSTWGWGAMERFAQLSVPGQAVV